MKWIFLTDKKPELNQKCWVCNDKDEVYICRYWNDGIFKPKYKFMNLLGHGWPVKDVVKWMPILIPKP